MLAVRDWSYFKSSAQLAPFDSPSIRQPKTDKRSGQSSNNSDLAHGNDRSSNDFTGFKPPQLTAVNSIERHNNAVGTTEKQPIISQRRGSPGVAGKLTPPDDGRSATVNSVGVSLHISGIDQGADRHGIHQRAFDLDLSDLFSIFGVDKEQQTLIGRLKNNTVGKRRWRHQSDRGLKTPDWAAILKPICSQLART